MRQQFTDRTEAGRELAARLLRCSWTAPVVLGLARGGVPVAHAVAVRLEAALDVAVSRKIGAPDQPELGVGAVTAQGSPTYDEDTLASLGLTPAAMHTACEHERAEARRRMRDYLGDREPVAIAGRDTIVVDDGIATGVTARAALRMLDERGPNRLVLAVPVSSRQAVTNLRSEADDVVCVHTPPRFQAVGSWYSDFQQTTDAEVIELLSTRS